MVSKHKWFRAHKKHWSDHVVGGEMILIQGVEPAVQLIEVSKLFIYQTGSETSKAKHILASMMITNRDNGET